MAKRGRKALNEATDPWHIEVPSGLAAKIDLLLLNPMTGKVKYGARKQLVVQLLQRWLKEQIEAGANAPRFEPDSSRYAGNRGGETPEE